MIPVEGQTWYLEYSNKRSTPSVQLLISLSQSVDAEAQGSPEEDDDSLEVC